MSYCTSAEVASEFKNIPAFSSSTLVTSADVAGFIVEADSLINSYVGNKYVIPVTGSGDGLNLLKLYSRSLVADRIRGILEVKQATSASASQAVRRGMSTADVIRALEKIQKGDVSLDGATPLLSSGGFYSKNSVDAVAPTFHKDTKEW